MDEQSNFESGTDESPEEITPPVKPKKTAGRPSSYSEAVANKILERMAEGETLSGICRGSKNMPDARTVRGWAINDIEGFAARYERARDHCLEFWADQIIDLSDNTTDDLLPDGRVNNDAINRSRLRVDARKWLLSKLKPERYGDRMRAELTGADGGAIKLKNLTPLELARRVGRTLDLGKKFAEEQNRKEIEDRRNGDGDD